MADRPWGLSDQGLEVPRFADYLTLIRDQYEAETGLQIDWGRDTFLGNITALMAQQLDQNAQLLHAVYDAQDPATASGIHLDKLCALTRVIRRQAQPATVELELKGDDGVTVPAGQIVEDQKRQRWITDASVTLTGEPGVAYVMARSEEVGQVSALKNKIKKIITPVSGWLSVDNPEDSTTGRDRESDADLRRRRELSLQVLGGSSCAAIRGRLLAFDFVLSAEVFDNPTNSTKTVAGVEAPPHSVVVYLYGKGDNGKLQNGEQQRKIAELLYNSLSAGVRTTGDDDFWTVTTADHAENIIQWNYAETTPINVTVTIEGGVVADVIPKTENIIEQYFNTLRVGETARRLPIIVELAKIENIKSVNVTFGDLPQDVEVAPYQIASIGVVNIV